MYSITFVVAWGVVCVFAAPADNAVTMIPIVEQWEEWQANGGYKYSYETANGIKREEQIYEKPLPKVRGKSSSAHVQKGSYSYTAPDGSIISMSYIADENGFRPIGKRILKGKGKSQTTASSDAPKTDESPAPAEGDQSPPATEIAAADNPAGSDQGSTAASEQATSADSNSSSPAEQVTTSVPDQGTSAASESAATDAASQAPSDSAATDAASQAPGDSAATDTASQAPGDSENPTTAAS